MTKTPSALEQSIMKAESTMPASKNLNTLSSSSAKEGEAKDDVADATLPINQLEEPLVEMISGVVTQIGQNDKEGAAIKLAQEEGGTTTPAKSHHDEPGQTDHREKQQQSCPSATSSIFASRRTNELVNTNSGGGCPLPMMESSTLGPLPTERSSPLPPRLSIPGAHAVAGIGSSSSNTVSPLAVDDEGGVDNLSSPRDANVASSSRTDTAAAATIPEGEEDNFQGLVTAKPVPNDDDIKSAIPMESTFMEGIEDGSSNNKKQSKKLSCWIIAISVFLLGISLAIIVISKRQTTNDESSDLATPNSNGSSINTNTTASSNATSTTTTGLLDLTNPILMNVLPNYTVDVLLRYEDAKRISSPQAKAYLWMQNDPNLDQYDNARILQRYVAAVLFLATNNNNTNDDKEGWTHTGGGTTSILVEQSALDSSNTNINSTSDGDENNSYFPIVREETKQYSTMQINITSKPWLSYNTNECEWFHIPNPVPLCYHGGEGPSSSPPQEFVNVNLDQNNLVGTLPPQISLLTHLQSLSLYRNDLEGTVPSQLGKLSLLRQLNFGHMSMTGTLPSQIGLLSDLELLSFLRGKLVGSIPSEIFALSKLHTIKLASNDFTGTLPWDMGDRLPHLDFILVGRNTHLTGPIPNSLGKLTKLIEIGFKECGFTGTIPTTLGKLTKLLRLGIGGNDLVGTIPSELGNLISLRKKISLGRNNLTGVIPSELGLLSQMGTLQLQENNLSGTLPSQLGLLQKIKALNLHSNALLFGNLPSQLGSLNESLQELTLVGTGISGTIPDSLCQIQTLEFECSDILCGCHCNCSF